MTSYHDLNGPLAAIRELRARDPRVRGVRAILHHHNLHQLHPEDKLEKAIWMNNGCWRAGDVIFLIYIFAAWFFERDRHPTKNNILAVLPKICEKAFNLRSGGRQTSVRLLSASDGKRAEGADCQIYWRPDEPDSYYYHFARLSLRVSQTPKEPSRTNVTLVAAPLQQAQLNQFAPQSPQSIDSISSLEATKIQFYTLSASRSSPRLGSSECFQWWSGESGVS
ncbi:hypothetical protein IWZ03DRAFT_409458 [Phyllosticta citriasiana]|uniref:Uncharacterized protein n=1 Tax=Phyllosticta citriasiana TaxID=595635 RepID=A0ABR1K9X7_9PEZI